MDWSVIDFSWNRARAFLATAEEGSLSRAAAALGSTQPTVGRQVRALEQELGVVLFERVGNRLALSPAGLDLVEHVRAMAEAATRVSLTATGRAQDIEGVVRITASQLVSAYLLGPALARLRSEHPALELELVASNTARDLQRREADIAVRNFAPAADELVARRLPDSPARLYATPGYLSQLGDPSGLTVEDLARAEVFGFGDVDQMVRGLSSLGLPLTPGNFPVRTQDHLVQWELCRQGVGICIVMERVGEAEPLVQQVLPSLPPIPVPVYLVSHRAVRTSRRIRVVFDALVDTLSDALRPRESG